MRYVVQTQQLLRHLNVTRFSAITKTLYNLKAYYIKKIFLKRVTLYCAGQKYKVSGKYLFFYFHTKY